MVVGDTVICIDQEDQRLIKNGEKYQVLEIVKPGIIIFDIKNNKILEPFYHIRRFELLKDYRLKRINQLLNSISILPAEV
jgi:hypothetical protein